MATARKPTGARSSDFVTVACKLPQGLHIKIAEPGPVIDLRLHGTHSPYAVAGHGLTEVRKEVWNAIVEHFKDNPAAKWLHNDLVFAQNKREDAVDAAEEREKVESGFEAVDPNNPNKAANSNALIQVEGSRDPGEGA